ncbi:Hypothetical predicted protein [Olea europaea subsp. europaea]|uniref:Uncharacterized protein n=1 Tax=Olea europaea subsp. europaea TaxID=158383 RepID=A0A8S0PNJ0_OLEEU|nr:Hypothetical predicted protein [Olea europaea subsp. europaea]
MVDIQTTQQAHAVGEECESQRVQLTTNDIATHILGATSCYYKGLGKGPKIPHAISRTDTNQRENAELCQVVHNLQSQNERILALLEEIMPGATARIGSPRVPTTPHSP